MVQYGLILIKDHVKIGTVENYCVEVKQTSDHDFTSNQQSIWLCLKIFVFFCANLDLNVLN